MGSLRHERMYRVMHVEFSLLKPSRSEGAVLYYAMSDVTQMKPESKDEVIGPY